MAVPLDQNNPSVPSSLMAAYLLYEFSVSFSNTDQPSEMQLLSQTVIKQHNCKHLLKKRPEEKCTTANTPGCLQIKSQPLDTFQINGDASAVQNAFMNLYHPSEVQVLSQTVIKRHTCKHQLKNDQKINAQQASHQGVCK